MTQRKLWSASWARMRAHVGRSLPVPCAKCGALVQPTDSWHLGHIVPRSLGGTDGPDNVAPEHARCNLAEAPSLQWAAKRRSANAPPSRQWFVEPSQGDPRPTSPEEVEPSQIW